MTAIPPGNLFNKWSAPSTLGSFLRGFTFGHACQLDAVASRFPENLAAITPDQETLLETHRVHPVFATSTLDTMRADKPIARTDRAEPIARGALSGVVLPVGCGGGDVRAGRAGLRAGRRIRTAT
ncbi:hypothetical protein [Arthrobacter sp. A5]|uniref:hypothetical protein n=1 Tax=Arthrobacter sp. A5 TaxID=576926 RepID=UPI003DA7C2D4